MSLSNFTFPGVTLTQVFEANTTAADAGMNVVCLGSNVITHNHSNEYGAASLGAFVAGSGIAQQTFPDYRGGTVTGTAEAVAVDAWFKFLAQAVTTDFNAPTSGSASSAIVFKHSMTGQTETETITGLSRGVKAGDKAIITDGSNTYTAYVTGVDAATPSTPTVYFSTEISSAVTAIDFLIKVTKTLTSASATINTTAHTVTILSTASESIDVGDGSTPKVVSGCALKECDNICLDYVENAAAFVNQIGVVGSTGEALEALGYPDSSNKLALAVYQAILNSNGNPVYFTAVPEETALAYTTALSLYDNNSDVYSVVPATSNQAVITALLSKCVTLSSDIESKVRRVLWYGVECSVEAASDSSRYNTISSFVVNDVISKRCTNSYRAQCVWSDGAIFNGAALPNFAVAAAAAGMRSGEPCHRPISNLSYSSFLLTEPHKLSMEYYRQIAKEGIWVIGNNSNGAAINFKQLTTAVSNENINLNEESCVANADNIALGLCTIGMDLVGCSNISQDLISMLDARIDAYMRNKLINSSGSASIGPQLTAYELVSIQQNTTNLDHVDAVISCTPVRPFNRFNMTLTVL